MPFNDGRGGQGGRRDPSKSHNGRNSEAGQSSSGEQSRNSRSGPSSGPSKWSRGGRGNQDQNARDGDRNDMRKKSSKAGQGSKLNQTDQSQSTVRGRGNFGSGSSFLDGTGAITDKREMTRCISELMRAVDTAKSDAMKRQSQINFLNRNSGGADESAAAPAPLRGSVKSNPKISHFVAHICKSRLPNREPSWSKEVTAALLTICYIPVEWLGPADYASFSRLITRASTSKQLCLHGIEIVSIYILLTNFIRRVGVDITPVSMGSLGTSNCFNSDAAAELPPPAAEMKGPPVPPRTSASNEKEVLHEVLRAFAQLLLINNGRIMRYRIETLELLVLCCHPRNNIDMESRHAAIDALGNILRTPTANVALQQPFLEEDIGLSSLLGLGGDSASARESETSLRPASVNEGDNSFVQETIFSFPLWQDDMGPPLRSPLRPCDLQNYQIQAYLHRCAARGELIETDMALVSEASKTAIYRRLRHERLGAVQNEGIYVLLENLKLCTARRGGTMAHGSSAAAKDINFSATSSSASSTPAINAAVQGSFAKLLVSCMRAVAQSMDAANTTTKFVVSSGSVHTDASVVAEDLGARSDEYGSLQLNFRPHLQSITQSAYFILTKVVPASMDINAETFDGRRHPSLHPASPSTSAAKALAGEKSGVSTTPGGVVSPSRAKAAINAGDGPTAGSGASVEPSSTSQQTKIWSHALRMLSSLAAYDSHALLGSWPLFLSDPQVCDSALAMTITGMSAEVQRFTKLSATEAQNNEEGRVNSADARVLQTQWACSAVNMLISSRLQHVLATALPTTTQPSMYSIAALPPFKNPLFLAALWAREPIIRSAAIESLRHMIEGLPIEKWLLSLRAGKGSAKTGGGGLATGKPPIPRTLFNNSTTGKITANIVKMLRLVVLLMSVERDEGVVSELCKAAHAFVRSMPLACVSTDTLSGGFAASRSGKEKLNTRSGTEVEVLEQLATLMFREALIICSESPLAAVWVAVHSGQAPASLSSTDINDLRAPSAAIHTLNWINEVCLLRERPLRSLHSALILPCYSLRSSNNLDIRTCNESVADNNDSSIGGTLEESPVVMIVRDRLAANERFDAYLRAAEKAAVRSEEQAEEYLSGAVRSIRESPDKTITGVKSYLDSRGSFVRALSVACGLHSEEPLNASTIAGLPFANAARRLQLSLLSRFPLLYYHDVARLRQSVLNAVHSECNALKLLGLRMLTALLGDDRGGGERFQSDSKNIGGLHIMEIVVILLRSACHQDHLIRGQAVSTFGQMRKEHWTSLRGPDGFLSFRSDILPHSTCEEIGIDTSPRAAILQCIITACGDSVGTVRTSAQKCLGDTIIAGGLNVDATLSYAAAHHNIFVTHGTNDVGGRIAQAKQVKAEAHSAAILQAKTDKYFEHRSLVQRLSDIERISEVGAARSDPVATTSSSDLVAGGSNNANAERRSHQIDLTRNYGLSSQQVAGENKKEVQSWDSRDTVPGLLQTPGRALGVDVSTILPGSTMSLQGDGTSRTLSYGDRCVNSEAIGAYRPSHQAVLGCLIEGCEDSKLSVRVQAAWAMGNLLMLFLPTRDLANDLRISMKVPMDAPDVSMTVADDEWLSLISLHLSLLDDSDKLLASTVRCLGVLSAGLTPWIPLHLRHLLVILDPLFAKVSLEESLNVSTDSTGLAVISSHWSRVRRGIIGHSAKVIYSLCQSISTIGWILCRRGDGDRDGIAPEMGRRIGEVRSYLAEMMQHGPNKVKLHAVRGLIALCHDHDVVTATKSRGDSRDSQRSQDPCARAFPMEVQEDRRVTLLHTLEACMCTAFEQSKIRGGRSRSRSLGDLERLLLVLLRVLLLRVSSRPAGDEAEKGMQDTTQLPSLSSSLSSALQQPVIDKLLFYQEELVDLLESASTDTSPYTEDELNACSVPLENSTPYSALCAPGETSLCSSSQLAAMMAQQALDVVSQRRLSADAGSLDSNGHTVETTLSSSITPEMDVTRAYGHISFTKSAQERLHHLSRGGTVPCEDPPSTAPYHAGSLKEVSPPFDAEKISRQAARVVLTSPDGNKTVQRGASTASLSLGENSCSSTKTIGETSSDSEDEDEI